MFSWLKKKKKNSDKSFSISVSDQSSDVVDLDTIRRDFFRVNNAINKLALRKKQLQFTYDNKRFPERKRTLLDRALRVLHLKRNDWEEMI